MSSTVSRWELYKRNVSKLKQIYPLLLAFFGEKIDKPTSPYEFEDYGIPVHIAAAEAVLELAPVLMQYARRIKLLTSPPYVLLNKLGIMFDYIAKHLVPVVELLLPLSEDLKGVYVGLTFTKPVFTPSNIILEPELLYWSTLGQRFYRNPDVKPEDLPKPEELLERYSSEPELEVLRELAARYLEKAKVHFTEYKQAQA